MPLKEFLARCARGSVSYVVAAMVFVSLPAQLRAQTQPSFTCSAGKAYLFQKDATDAYELDLRTGTLTQKTFNGITLPDKTTGGKYNAFGYNQRDNYIWGQVYNDSKVIRIGGDFSGQVFSVANLPAKPFVVGDISPSGIMYLAIGGSNATDVIYAIDLTQTAPSSTTPALSATTLPTTLSYITDWGVSPRDGNLYAVSSNVGAQTGAPVLYRFLTANRLNADQTTTAAGTRETLGTLTGGNPAIAGSNFGSAFMDTNGSFYVVTNDKGIVYRIDTPDQLPVNGSPTVTYVSQPSAAPNASNTDGARCASSAVPLPVELVAFSAAATLSRTVALSWTTASEMHNAYFEVQRSLDGRTFAVVGQVLGHGSTAQASTYQFTDATPTPGTLATAYYRLRQVDTDGGFSFSPVRTVALGPGSRSLGLAVAPNPAPAGHLRLQLSSTDAAPTAATLTLTDLLGRRLHTQAVTLPPGTTDVSLEAVVAPGAYWLQLSELDGSVRQGIRVLLTD